MKNFFYIAGLGVILSACGGESTTPENNSTDTVQITTDTVAIVPSNAPISPALLAKFKVNSNLPFVQDSAWLGDLELEAALTADEVKYLTFGFVDTDISWSGMSPVEDFLFFDSLAAADEYDAYVETADIGMTVYSDAYVAQKVTLDDSTQILLWVVNHGTADSCPFGAGRVLYGSVLRNNAVASCTILGEDFAGADPPVWDEGLTLVSVKKDGISVWKRYKSGGGETDEEGNELIDETIEDFILGMDANGAWKQEEIVISED